MATVPIPDTWAAGEKPTALKLNTNIRDSLNFLLNPPTCQVSCQAAPTPASSAFIQPTFDTEELDTDGMFTGPNTKITIVTPGIYEVNANLGWAGNGTGWRLLAIRLNGTAIAQNRWAPPTTFSNGSGLSILQRCVAGDFFDISIAQNSGGTLAVGTGAEAPRLSVHWTGK